MSVMSLLRECTENTSQISVSGTILVYALAFTRQRRKVARQQSNCCIQRCGPWEGGSAVWGGGVGCTIAMELFGKHFHTIL